MSEQRSERQRVRSGVPAKSRSDFVPCRCAANGAMSARAKSNAEVSMFVTSGVI